MNKSLNKWVAMALTAVMLVPGQLVMATGGSAEAEPAVKENTLQNIIKSDIYGHWAEKDFNSWYEKQLIKGYGDGNFKPNQAISRAEFMTLINRVFNFVEEKEVSFSDLTSSSSFYTEVKKAVAAGYLSGYSDGTIRPNAPITRQEAAVILFRAFQMKESGTDEIVLTDTAGLPAWSKEAVETFVSEGYITGYDDHTFRPANKITRAEALRLVNNISGEILTQEGTYTSLKSKNVIINKANITLKDTVIEGNLYLTEGIAEGDVTLDKVTVKGSIQVNGGGQNSIKVNDSDIAQIFVDKKNGKLRILTQGTTAVGQVFVLSGVKLEEEASSTGTGFSKVIIDQAAGTNATIALAGNFDEVEVSALTSLTIQVLKGIISKMILEQKASLHVDEAAEIKDIVIQVDGKIKVTGSGKVSSDSQNGTKLDRDSTPAVPSQMPAPTAVPTVTPIPTATPAPTASPAPVFQNVSVHDPSVVKVDGTYYVFGSHLAAAKSTDLMSWSLIDSGVTETNKLFKSAESDVKKELAEALGWAETDTLWAADVIQLADGKFYMYYNACKGDQPLSALGVAVADNIEGPYVNKGIFLKSGKGISADGTAYNGTQHPNTVDPDTFFDKEGKLWMVYGSYSGGIFILQMDSETGFPLANQGHGKRLMGQNHSRIEAPYIQYNPSNGYYYLFVTFGGLDAIGGYNMRISRSLNPDGPYVDYEGQDMIDAHGSTGTFFEDTAIAPYGVKAFGNFIFSNLNGETNFPTYGYVSAGHNSTYYDEATGKWFNIFHSRFPFRGEGHEVRVHQMFVNQDGWPVVAPHRYGGETIAKITESDVVGAYHYIKHGKEITKDIKPSVYVKLLADGTVAGAVTGSWEIEGDYFAKLTVNETVDNQAVQTTYKGVFIRQWDPTSEAYVMAFSALSGEGISVWGSQLEQLSDQEMVTNAANILTIGDTSRVYKDIVLPAKAASNWPITWESSNSAVVSSSGAVTRPDAGDGNAEILLTATIHIGSATANKTFTVNVQKQSDDALADGLVAQYDFEDTLNEAADRSDTGVVTGNRINNTGGEIAYVEGSSGKGKAVSLNGSTGVRLPDGLISTNEYTVSMWLNPVEAANLAPAFFGAQTEESWISFLPRGHDFATNNTMLWAGTAWFDASTGMKINLGEWTHVAFTVQNGATKVYINGVQKYSGTGMTNIFNNKQSVFALGVNYWDTPYKGLIDEVRIYEMALNAEKIGWLAFGEPDSSVFVDDIQFGAPQKTLAVGTNYTPETTILPVNAANKTVIWSSDDSGIAAVDEATGQVTGVAIGTATITAAAADDGHHTASYTVHVTDGDLAHYAFESNLADSLDRAPAGLITGNRINNMGGNITYETGIAGAAAVLDGSSGIRLPDGIINGNVYSVSMWLNPAEATNFAAAFFGSRTNESWISLVPRGPGNHDTMLWSGTAWYDASAGLKINLGQWTHVAFTVNNGTAKVYVNGVQKFSGTGFPNVFTNESGVFGIGVNYWDTPYKGLVDELKIYNKALTAQQVAADFSIGNMVSLNLDAKSLKVGEQVTLTANRPVTWGSSNEAAAVVDSNGTVTAVSAGNAVITAASISDSTQKATASITVTEASSGFDEADGLLIKLDFDGNVNDSSGNNKNAVVKNNRVEYVAGRSANNQAAQFLKAESGSAFDNIPVKLPDNLISGDQAYTVAAWVKWNGAAQSWAQAWSSIYFSDTFVAANSPLNYYLNLGLNGTNQLFISQPVATTSNPLPVGEWAHVAMTVVPGGKTTLYLNGIQAAQADSDIRTTQGFNEHFIGGNFWDQNFNGAMDEFRMYGKALSSDEVSILAGAAN
ncbi:LamG-like jellyroll fold domain-containing protein [Candidatus Pristimantibacillus sp. PTI5]|uniref:LamG-like jellyroll fold domain-containing protein n=1 Tax=Candidatus Pristimantibacillus sp. PTI5 TaxID=3400422 RepID=UPI003B02A573